MNYILLCFDFATFGIYLCHFANATLGINRSFQIKSLVSFNTLILNQSQSSVGYYTHAI